MTNIFRVWRTEWGPRAVAGLVLLFAAAAATPASPGHSPASVDTARLATVDGEPENWFTGGRDRDGSYYSPLASINAVNVAQLGFAWQYDLGLPRRGQEATPIVVDGVMYTSGTWGFVYALDAATGREVWRYDPKAVYQAARNPCCDLVNRGVAVWKGRVYVASVDGRLHALDARTGRPRWVVDTIADHTLPYSSTGAPQVAGKVVVIGNSGSDMGRGGVRGYVTAYDLDTGARRWRFYTVPPTPGHRYEHPELAAADQTWPAATRRRLPGRRDGLGRLRIRPEARPRLFRHGERGAVRPASAGAVALRRALHCQHRRAARRHRPDGVVLPGDAPRPVGL